MRTLQCFYFYLITTLGLCLSANASDFGLVGGNRAFSLKVSSFKEQRFKTVVPQKYDFSCGSAALATLLKYHYDYPITEQEVLDSMYKVGDQDKIKKQGFSLLDMKQYLANIKLSADGYNLKNIEKISAAGVPGIALINTNGYMHFVVIKGVNQSHVLIGDPALGIRKVSRDDFADMWNNVFFVIRNNTDQARFSFSHEDTWSSRRKALFETALSNTALASFSVHTSLTPNVYQGF
jgi:hypothetical protein